MRDISDSYLDRYRRKLADLETIETEVSEIRKKFEMEMMEIGLRKSRISNEIQEMRQVITTMIDHGVDPVEAKLRNDQRKETIWNVTSKDEFGISSIEHSGDNTFDSISTLSIGSVDISTPYMYDSSNNVY